MAPYDGTLGISQTRSGGPVRDTPPRRTAVIGSGAAGLGAAWALDQRHHVTLFEASDRPGGHAHTVDVTVRGRRIPVDTGFIVYNERNYPNLVRLFAALGVATSASDMSFAVSMDGGRFEYKGSGAGMFARRANLIDPRVYHMAGDIIRFYRRAPEFLKESDKTLTLEDYLHREVYSRSFVERHLLPMGAAIWSCTPSEMLAFPARSFIQFCQNHGLLRLSDRPQWRTVSGGSRQYVNRIVGDLRGEVRLSTPVARVKRTRESAVVLCGDGTEERFDALVIAGHADQALAVLGDQASADERAVLGAFRYTANRAVLHSDPALMPTRRAAWASWNYVGPATHAATGLAQEDHRLCVTYWMNKLQNIDPDFPLFVTLNPTRDPDPALVHRELVYEHPLFDAAAMNAQERLPDIQGKQRIWFCGAYFGHGFHEDALRSGLAAAAGLGATPAWSDRPDRAEAGTEPPARSVELQDAE